MFQLWLFPGLFFPVFGLHTEITELSLYLVQMRRNADQKNFKFGHLSCIVAVLKGSAYVRENRSTALLNKAFRCLKSSLVSPRVSNLIYVNYRWNVPGVLLHFIVTKLYNFYHKFLLTRISFLQLNPNLGGLFSCSFWGGGGGKVTPCLKLVRITPDASNLARKYIPLRSFRKYTF